MAATLFAPFAFHPHRTTMRRTAIRAVDPDVPVSVPTVLARNPYIALLRRRGSDLDGAWRRRTDADDDLSIGRANGKK